LFPSTRSIGKSFGVMQVTREHHTYEVATFRIDHQYTDGRRPDRVEFSTAEHDAQRRDFTINGMFYDPMGRKVIDFVQGRKDLEARRIRAIGSPDLRFSEDHLRMVRAVRFAGTLAFVLDRETEEAIRAHAACITEISQERITHELTRLLTESVHPGETVRLLHRTGLLVHLLPEIAALADQEQPPDFHPEGDVLTHTTMMLDEMRHPTMTLAYAILFHDVGKPATAQRTREPDGTDRLRFNQHAPVGAEMTEAILNRLRLPKQHIRAIVHCVRNHMRFMEVPNMRDATLRRLIGALTFPVELELHRVDCLCSHGDLSNIDFLKDYIETLRHQPVLPERWIDGNDVLALDIPAGPAIGRWLAHAYEAQLNGQAEDREALLSWLKTEIERDR
jgi:poly(A) polymerase